MKIKIGNFNFISNNENKIVFSSYTNLDRNLNYFYLDGKEDTLIIENDFEFDKEKYNMKIPEYEKSLLNKYKVIPLYKEITKQINAFIENKIKKAFENKSYSRYELYKDVNFSIIFNARKTQKYTLERNEKGTEYDFDKNRIKYNDFIFNPYTLEVENLKEVYEFGFFNDEIKLGLILKEIETNCEPPFVKEILKISNFLSDKKSVNLYIKNLEPFKINSQIYSFLKIEKDKIKIDLRWEEEKNFENANPNANYRYLKIEDLEKLTYSKKELKIDSENLLNLKCQISKTPEDLLLFKIDELKDNIEKEFHDYRIKKDINNISNDSIPYSINEALNKLTKIDMHNIQVKSGNSNEDMLEKPFWNTKELDEILYKNDLINELEHTDSIETINNIAKELGDKELQQIYYALKNEEESEEDTL